MLVPQQVSSKSLSFILTGLLLGATTISHYIGFPSKVIEVLGILGGILLVTSLLMLKTPVMKTRTGNTGGYQLDEDDDLVRVFTIGKREIKVSLPDDERFDLSKQYADALDSSINAGWLQFKDRESSNSKPGTISEEIAGLELVAFQFCSVREPHVAEVYLENPTRGRCWVCLYKKGQFSNLRLAE